MCREVELARGGFVSCIIFVQKLRKCFWIGRLLPSNGVPLGRSRQRVICYFLQLMNIPHLKDMTVLKKNSQTNFLKIWYCEEKSWFTTMERQFSFSFHWSPSISNFLLCLLETQVFRDQRGSILSNRAESFSLEGQYGCQPEEISTQTTLGQEKTNSKHG